MFALSPTEKEIMEVLWKNEGGMTNNELIEFFKSQGKEWKRQTTNTFFTRLMQKGFVTKKGHKYLADCTKAEFTKKQAGDILETMYDGSLKNFVTALYNGEELTEEQSRTLNELISSLEK